MDIVVTCVEIPREKPTIDVFLQKYFFHELTVLEAFGLDSSTPPPIPPNADLIIKAEGGGELVGVSYCTTAPTPLWDRNLSLRHSQLVEFFEFVEQDSKLFELPGRPLELWLMAVHPQWRNRGIASRLAAQVCRSAADLGYTSVTVLCTGEFSAGFARRLGWRQLYRLAYADYPEKSGRQVQLTPTPPHDHIYLFIKDI